MTDKELLELAAKAAGYEIEGDADNLVAQPGRYAGGFSILNDKDGSSLWNPLTDDGDALRLAVKLELDVWFEGVGYVKSVGLLGEVQEVKMNDDPYTATRRAIVRAAAEIGRAMK